jgi:hypothetical protein
MTDTDQSSATLDKWQAALRKREELQDLLRGVDSLVQDGSIKLSSVDEVRNLLVAAQKEVDQLQALIKR